MPKPKAKSITPDKAYNALIGGIGLLVEGSRQVAARSLNSLMTATYWEIGRRIVEFEQKGEKRASYGKELIANLSKDLTASMGNGFGQRNLAHMRAFYLSYPEILQTASAKSMETPPHANDSRADNLFTTSLQQSAKPSFPLPWSHYVRLLGVASVHAREFYHCEARRGGWSVRQLDRQSSSLFYERIALSKNKASLLRSGQNSLTGETPTAQTAIRDPLVLEFLDLRDEYAESDLEAALIRHLETFLLELGSDFAFVGRQRRLRIDDEWYRVDLLFYHRRLRCLVIIDLKLGKFTHADAGQMNLYINYAKEHWTHSDENPPIGLILCSEAGKNLVHYTLENLANPILAREY